ncbi:MAG: NAD+ synthase [Armatimonadetes bacterium]|nr:NAD+ synthase [Armatimonadota bacterium]
MKILVAQLNPIIGKIKSNTEKILRVVDLARRIKTDLVVFPELALIGYPPRDLLWRRELLEQGEAVLSKKIAPASTQVGILIGAPVREEGDLYNAALLFAGGRLAGRQDKTLLPDYDVFEESRYFQPAKERKPVLFQGVKLGLTVCEDVWNDKDYWNRRLYPLDPVEELITQGADLIINISASPYYLGKIGLRADMLQKMAAKYRKAFLYVNQVGGNDELIFDGTSLAVDPRGETICRAGSFGEDALCLNYTVNKLSAEDCPAEKQKIFPEKVYRAPVPEDVSCLYRALVLGISDYLRKTGFRRALVGLSGGIDSSVTAALAAAACGPENVLGVAMPSAYSSPGSVTDARRLAANLGIGYREIPIQNILDSYLQVFNRGGVPLVDLAEENIQARIRGNILMFISNREGYLVLTTGNKSELAVGYCTLYGDMSGGLAVISDVPKTMVYALAGYINREREIIPAGVLTKPPSAELKPGQTDQDSLPPYEVLDAVLRLYVEENRPAAEIVAAGFDPALVQEIIQKVDRAEYKRRQAPPGLKVTTKAFGLGRRLPIAWQKG